MLGFPTAFTLMGMGVFFGWLAYRSVNPALANQQILDLMVQRAYSVMSNDVLIAIPLFVFMGYLVERANLIEKLFKSLHLSLARVPGALAVATIVTCAIFATATGIVGAVVTLMGLLALPAMLRAGYNIKLAAGAITAGGCLGILIPPSVLLIVYGATAGVSVVKLYAGAFFPGIMLAALYVGYVIIVAKWKPHLAPPLAESERLVPLPPLSQTLSARGGNALAGLFGALRDPALPKRQVATQLFVSLLPAISIVALLALMYGCARRRPPPRSTRPAWCNRAARWSPATTRPRSPRGCRSRRRKKAGCRSRRRRAPISRSHPPSWARRHQPQPPRRRPSARALRAAAAPAAASACRAGCGPDLVLDRVRPGHGRPAAGQLADELAAAGDLQDAAGLVLPAGGDDHRRARLDRLRPGHADRSRRRGRIRRPAAGRRLSLRRGQAGQERQSRGENAGSTSAASSRSPRS